MMKYYPTIKIHVVLSSLAARRSSSDTRSWLCLKNTALDCVHVKSEEALFPSSHKKTNYPNLMT